MEHLFIESKVQSTNNSKVSIISKKLLAQIVIIGSWIILVIFVIIQFLLILCVFTKSVNMKTFQV